MFQRGTWLLRGHIYLRCTPRGQGQGSQVILRSSWLSVTRNSRTASQVRLESNYATQLHERMVGKLTEDNMTVLGIKLVRNVHVGPLKVAQCTLATKQPLFAFASCKNTRNKAQQCEIKPIFDQPDPKSPHSDICTFQIKTRNKFVCQFEWFFMLVI